MTVTMEELTRKNEKLQTALDNAVHVLLSASGNTNLTALGSPQVKKVVKKTPTTPKTPTSPKTPWPTSPSSISTSGLKRYSSTSYVSSPKSPYQ